MELLPMLTLIYVAVLVVALAASLITILVYLWRIGTVLGDARAALGTVLERTQPLGGLLQPLELLQSRDIEALEQAAKALHRADQMLADATTPAGAA